MNNQTPKLFSTIVPGGMDMEEWSAGGYSKFLHGDGSCNKEIENAINSFKTSLLGELAFILDCDEPDEDSITAMQRFIKNYKP